VAEIAKKSKERPRIPVGIGRGQKVGRLAVGWILRWYCRLEVRGVEHIPRSGPVILAANHRSMLDVPLMGISSPRPMVFMAKKELFGDPVRAWLWDWLGGFPVRRDISDLRALDIGLAILEQGNCLALYPEGTRSKSAQMLPFLKGAAWLALRTSATIVPCGITGTERRRGIRRLTRMRVRMTFGDALAVEAESDPRARRERSRAITENLLESVNALMA
jgi:1-acyl-sn-glycerol-3-phosphate acyltransferase